MFIFVDFDDVVYLHRHHWLPEDDMKNCWNFAVDGSYEEGAYKDSEYNSAFIELLERVKETNKDNIHIVLITAEKYSLTFEKKINFTKARTGVFDRFVSVGSSADKVAYMKYYVSMFHQLDEASPLKDCIVIEDNIFVCAEAEDNGAKGFTPQYFEHIGYRELL